MVLPFPKLSLRSPFPLPALIHILQDSFPLGFIESRGFRQLVKGQNRLVVGFTRLTL